MRLLIVALLALIIPSAASAEALSPWVDGVLQRVKSGMIVASSRSPGPCTDDTVLRDIWQARDAVTSSILPSIEAAERRAALREYTLCFESDRRLLTEAIAQVLAAMDDAVRSCNGSGLRVLLETFDFLYGAYVSFLSRGIDPTYQDDRLRRTFAFESDWEWTHRSPSQGELDPLSDAPLCPFTTDFVPHAIAGEGSSARSYGCDVTVLSSLPPSMAAEADVLRAFMEKLDSTARPLFTSIRSSLIAIDELVAALTGRTSGPLPGEPLPPPQHEELTGCLRPASPFSALASAAVRSENERLAFPWLSDPVYPWSDFFGSIPTRDPEPDELLPFGLPLRFSHIGVIDAVATFLTAKQSAGFSRPLPGLFYHAGTTDVTALYRRVVEVPVLRKSSADIDHATAVLEALSRDGVERVQSSSLPLRAAVSSLVDVTTNFLPKEYIPSVAYFLLRSCSGGPCEGKLRTVLQRIHNPSCLPYISGAYTKERIPEQCFCDPSVEQSDPAFFDAYCRTTLRAEDIEAYRSRPEDLRLVCDLDGAD